MKVEFINAILQSTANVLSTMADVQIKSERPVRENAFKAKGDVTGCIELRSPQANGTLAISFSRPLILDIFARVLEEDAKEVNEEVVNLVGEITNMVSGGAKRSLEDQGYDFAMTLPSVICGAGKDIVRTDGKGVIVPLHAEKGEMYIEVCFSMPTSAQN